MTFKLFYKNGITILIQDNQELIKISDDVYKIMDKNLLVESGQGSSNTPVLMTNQNKKPQIYWEI